LKHKQREERERNSYLFEPDVRRHHLIFLILRVYATNYSALHRGRI